MTPMRKDAICLLCGKQEGKDAVQMKTSSSIWDQHPYDALWDIRAMLVHPFCGECFDRIDRKIKPVIQAEVAEIRRLAGT